MTAEWLTALGTIGTFVVITASALAALFQLRHMRSSNQIATIAQLRQLEATPEFKTAERFVQIELPKKIEDPAFRHQMAHREARDADAERLAQAITMYADYYETMGSLVKNRFLDRRVALDLFSLKIMSAWRSIAPLTPLFRRRMGSVLGENLDYLFVLAEDYLRAHPNGTYPRGMRRVDIPDVYLEEDAKYEEIRGGAQDQGVFRGSDRF